MCKLNKDVWLFVLNKKYKTVSPVCQYNLMCPSEVLSHYCVLFLSVLLDGNLISCLNVYSTLKAFKNTGCHHWTCISCSKPVCQESPSLPFQYSEVTKSWFNIKVFCENISILSTFSHFVKLHIYCIFQCILLESCHGPTQSSTQLKMEEKLPCLENVLWIKII